MRGILEFFRAVVVVVAVSGGVVVQGRVGERVWFSKQLQYIVFFQIQFLIFFLVARSTAQRLYTQEVTD